MSIVSVLEKTLAQVIKREREYEWLAAVESYRKIVESISEQDLRMGHVYERLGYAFHRAAMQAEGREEFRERIGQGIAHYQQAIDTYDRFTDAQKRGRILRCEAMISYLHFWLASYSIQKRRILEESWNLAKKALKVFEKDGEALEYALTFQQSSISASLACGFEWKIWKDELKQIVEFGEQAIKCLVTLADDYNLARVYAQAAGWILVFSWSLPEPDERERTVQKALGYWLKANELCEEAALLEISDPNVALLPGLQGGLGTDETIKTYERALEYDRKTEDRFITGASLSELAYHLFWKARSVEHPDEKRQLLSRALHHAEQSVHHYDLISLPSPVQSSFWVGAPHAEYYYELAKNAGDLGERRDLLGKALEAAPDLLKTAEKSGYRRPAGYAHLTLARILIALSKIETSPEKKKKLLEKASDHTNESARIMKEVAGDWGKDTYRNMLAVIESELRKLVRTG